MNEHTYTHTMEIGQWNLVGVTKGTTAAREMTLWEKIKFWLQI